VSGEIWWILFTTQLAHQRLAHLLHYAFMPKKEEKGEEAKLLIALL